MGSAEVLVADLFEGYRSLGAGVADREGETGDLSAGGSHYLGWEEKG